MDIKELRKKEIAGQTKIIEKNASSLIEVLNEGIYDNIEDNTCYSHEIFEVWQNDINDLLDKLANKIYVLGEPDFKIDNKFCKEVQDQFEELVSKINEIDSVICEYESDFTDSAKHGLTTDVIKNFINDNYIEDIKEQTVNIYYAAKEIKRLEYANKMM